MRATYANLVEVVAAGQRLPKSTTRRVLDAFFEQLADAVWEQGRVSVPGLGAFRVRARRARRIANPVTGQPMQLPRERAVACRVASSWRRRG